MLETVCGNVEIKVYFVYMPSNRDVRTEAVLRVS
jgi:hypothetical protein